MKPNHICKEIRTFYVHKKFNSWQIFSESQLHRQLVQSLKSTQRKHRLRWSHLLSGGPGVRHVLCRPSARKNEQHTQSYLWLPGNQKVLQNPSSESRLVNARRCCCADCWSRCCRGNTENQCEDSERVIDWYYTILSSENRKCFCCCSGLFGISRRRSGWNEHELALEDRPQLT